jgi:hypothetical protein
MADLTQQVKHNFKKYGQNESLLQQDDDYFPAQNLEDVYSTQMRFIQLLQNGSEMDSEFSFVSIASNNFKSPLCRGPYLVRPSPPDVPTGSKTSSFETIPSATDILYIDSDPIGILAIAFSDGRVDLCLEFDPPEALFGNQVI